MNLARLTILAVIALACSLTGCSHASTTRIVHTPTTETEMNNVANLAWFLSYDPTHCRSILSTFGRIEMQRLKDTRGLADTYSRIYITQAQKDCAIHDYGAVRTDGSLLQAFARANGATVA